MPLLVVLIVISFAFYIFYKMKYVRSNRPAERKWLSAKSSMTLGLFVCLFGINELFLYHTMITYMIAAIFILMGGLSGYSGVKAYKYYRPYAAKEAESLDE